MRRVVLESPFAGDIERNVKYARECVRDCLLRGEAPLASHLIYTQMGILNDYIPSERQLGMEAGWAWTRFAEAVVIYTDYGISSGMNAGIEKAVEFGIPIEYRRLYA